MSARAMRQPAAEMPLALLLGAIPSLPRPVLARLTMRLIERLDDMDGDPDLEDDTEDRCEAGDDGCGMVRAVGGYPVWGSNDDEAGAAFPAYGTDQTRGPVNVCVNVREYLAREGGV